jgi:hypothetical protein
MVLRRIYGDVQVHEFGGNKSKNGPFEPMYTVAGKKQEGADGSAVSYNVHM